MKKYLNTLFITTQGAYVSKEGLTILIKVEKKVVLRVPIHTIGGIICFGRISCSPYLLGFCADNDISISFMTETGRFLAKVQGPVSGNVLLRREQYRKADQEESCYHIAKSIITGKLINCRSVLQRAIRDHTDKLNSHEIKNVSMHIQALLKTLTFEKSLNVLRGIEGEVASQYFSVFDHLILSQKEDFYFKCRSRRPPLDRVNCLLSFIYTLLVHDVRSALETVGLDPAVGFLHKDRPGRPGLALDLMEEFRPFIADRLALSLINLGQIKGKGFRISESGAVIMDDETKKKLLVVYQDRKKDEIIHPFLDEKIPIGNIFFIQALLLARHLRGDLDAYPPFIWR